MSMRRYTQDVRPANARPFTFNLRDFSGGMNNRSETVRDNEARSILNMRFSNDTLMEKRNGYEHYGAHVADAPITLIDRYRPYKDADKLVYASDTKLYVDDVEIATLAGRATGVNVNGRYAFVDGEKFRMYGKFPQEAGTYVRIVGTAVDEHTVFSIVNTPADAVRLDTEHVEGVRVYDYDTLTCWYEPCQLEVEDTSKAGNATPANCRYIVQHGNRLYMAGDDKEDDTIYISDVDNPMYFPAAVSLQVPPNSDKIHGLAVYDDAVVIGRRDDIHVITGKTNDPELGLPLYELKKLNTHAGIASQGSMLNAHNYLFFLGSDGNAYALSAVRLDDKSLATQIISAQLDLFKEPFNFVRDDFYTASSTFFRDEWFLHIKDKTLVYNYRLRAWTVFDGMNARSLHILSDEVVWGNEQGTLSHFSDEYLDYGFPYHAHWTSRYFDMGDASITKQFKEFQAVMFSYDDFTSEVNLHFEIDYARAHSEFMSDNKISIWGKAVFGSRFIDRNINTSNPIFVGLRGRLLSITIASYPVPSAPVTTVNELALYPRVKNGMLVYVSDENRFYEYVQETLDWRVHELAHFNQPMKIYSVTGEYEYKHKR